MAEAKFTLVDSRFCEKDAPTVVHASMESAHIEIRVGMEDWFQTLEGSVMSNNGEIWLCC